MFESKLWLSHTLSTLCEDASSCEFVRTRYDLLLPFLIQSIFSSPVKAIPYVGLQLCYLATAKNYCNDIQACLLTINFDKDQVSVGSPVRKSRFKVSYWKLKRAPAEEPTLLLEFAVDSCRHVMKNRRGTIGELVDEWRKKKFNAFATIYVRSCDFDDPMTKIRKSMYFNLHYEWQSRDMN